MRYSYRRLIGRVAVAAVALAGMVAFAAPASAQTTTQTNPTATPNPTSGNTALTAQVICDALAGEPGGTVSFFDGPPGPGTFLGTRTLVNASPGTSNTATPINVILTPGTHTINAVYSGGGNCDASIGTVVVNVTATSPPPCTQTISGPQFGNVNSTGSLCLTPGARIVGNVTVTGGTLNSQGAQIFGNVTVTGGTGVRICATAISGNLSVTGVNGVVLIGDAGDDPGTPCAGNSIGGTVNLSNNTGSLEFSANGVSGSVTVNNNNTTIVATPPEPTATELESNSIGGNLGCVGNTVNGVVVPNNPTNDGKPNAVAGIRSGQCVGL